MDAIKQTFEASTDFITVVAKLGSIVRLNIFDRDASVFCFVSDETLQLEIAPVADPIVHGFSSVCFPHAFEVLHDDLVSFETGNNLPADIVVYPFHPTIFSSVQLFQETFCRPSAFGLKLGSQVLEFPLDLLDFRGFEKSCIRSYSKIVYAKVNPKYAFCVSDAYISGKSEQEKASAFFIDPKKAFNDSPIFEISSETFWYNDVRLLPAFDSNKTQHIVFNRGRPWEIVSYRNTIDSRFCFGSFDHAAGLLDAGDSKLAWKAFFPDLDVNKGMKPDIVFDLSLPGSINAELQSLFVNIAGLDNLIGCIDPDLCNSNIFHGLCSIFEHYNCCGQMSSVKCDDNVINTIRGEQVSIPPTIEILGILETIL